MSGRENEGDKVRTGGGANWALIPAGDNGRDGLTSSKD